MNTISSDSRPLQRWIERLDNINLRVGNTVAWFSAGSVFVCFAVVVLRYGFSIAIVWMQELYVWLNAAMFIVGAGATFTRNEHVRVDLFYGKMRNRTRCYVNLIGTIFLLFPFLALVGYYSWDFTKLSWSIAEGSGQIGGLPGLFLLKSTILAFVVLVGLQGLSFFLRSIDYLMHANEISSTADDDYLSDAVESANGGAV